MFPFDRRCGNQVGFFAPPGMTRRLSLARAALQRGLSPVRLASGASGYIGHDIMPVRGKLIAIEGIDGSGKRTQVELLATALRTQGHSVHSTGFPQYVSWFGKMVGQFLNGELGPLESVDPHFTARSEERRVGKEWRSLRAEDR